MHPPPPHPSGRERLDISWVELCYMFPPALVNEILHDWEDEVRDNQFKNNRHNGKTSACPMRASHADVPLVRHEINPPQGTFVGKVRVTKPYERLLGKLVPCISSWPWFLATRDTTYDASTTPHPSPMTKLRKTWAFSQKSPSLLWVLKSRLIYPPISN